MTNSLLPRDTKLLQSKKVRKWAIWNLLGTFHTQHKLTTTRPHCIFKQSSRLDRSHSHSGKKLSWLIRSRPYVSWCNHVSQGNHDPYSAFLYSIVSAHIVKSDVFKSFLSRVAYFRSITVNNSQYFSATLVQDKSWRGISWRKTNFDTRRILQ